LRSPVAAIFAVTIPPLLPRCAAHADDAKSGLAPL